MKYYLYANLSRNRARVHEQGCSFIRVHGGAHKYDQGRWDEFNTKAEAMKELAVLKARGWDARTCPRCEP